MDLKQYYIDLNQNQAKLEIQFPDGIVHVTSLFYRERNSTPGHTSSATHRNAARVITDGTHRVATEPEINDFYQRQEDQRLAVVRSEQQKKRQFVVMVDGGVAETIQRQPLKNSAPAPTAAVVAVADDDD